VASIHKRGNGWQARVRRQGHPAVTRTFTRRRDAEQWARAPELTIERGGLADLGETRRTRLSELLSRYSDEVLPSKRSWRSERSRIQRLTTELGHHSLATLRASHVAMYRDARLRSVGPQAVKHELSPLRRILNLSEREWGLFLPAGNPVSGIRMPILPRGRERRLGPDDESILLQALSRTPMVQRVVSFALETAMRRGELTALVWADVNSRNAVVSVNQTKTGVPRTVPLSRRARSLLPARDPPLRSRRLLDRWVVVTPNRGRTESGGRAHKAHVRAFLPSSPGVRARFCAKTGWSSVAVRNRYRCFAIPDSR
jgi:integrase